MLSLHKLEVFSRVVQDGSFSRAATNLYMTQSAVSQHIQDLEASLGNRLFERGRRGVSLTTAGERLSEYTERILRLVADAEAAVTNVANLSEGQVKIGATPGINVYWLPEWIQSFRMAYPRLSVSMQTGITSHIVDGVLGNQLSIGFVEGELDGLQATHLERLDLQDVEHCIVVAQNNEWWASKTIDVADMAGRSFIMRQQSSQTRIWLDALLKQREVSLNVVAEFDNPESIKHAVMSSACATILPCYAIQRELAAGTLQAIGLRDLALRRVLKLIWDARRPFDAITRAFLGHLAMTYPQLHDIA